MPTEGETDMLTSPSSEQARRLRDFFLANGYTELGIREQAQRAPAAPLFAADPGPVVPDPRGLDLPFPARCFFLGQPVSPEAVAALPADILVLLQRADCCVVTATDGDLAALIAPCRDLWLASDTFAYRETPQARDYVMPLNEPALALLDFAVSCDGGRMLDLCSGILLHGLAAGAGAQVVGSDLNPRAAMFGAFNAALNGRDDVTCVTGDLFAPVAGQRFDLILSNPPFVISPGSDHPHRENPLELDDFCRRMLGEVGEHTQRGRLPPDHLRMGRVGRAALGGTPTRVAAGLGVRCLGARGEPSTAADLRARVGRRDQPRARSADTGALCRLAGTSDGAARRGRARRAHLPAPTQRWRQLDQLQPH